MHDTVNRLREEAQRLLDSFEAEPATETSENVAKVCKLLEQAGRIEYYLDCER